MKVKILYVNDRETVAYTRIERATISVSLDPITAKELSILELKHRGRHITSININRVEHITITED